ncbi:hypothetical protein HDZ31DRAFT_71777 [Schizophyllum fasciatum]
MTSHKPPELFSDIAGVEMEIGQPDGRRSDFHCFKRKRAANFVRTTASKCDRQPASAQRTKHDEYPGDLAQSIPRLYRILDLISEQGSGGLVDKVIIAQESLAQFLDDVSPGAYQSLTKVDFKSLDKLSVKPIGVYGSKSEIVKLLETTKVVSGRIGRQLLDTTDDLNRPKLRSGLYFVRMTLPSAAEEQLFVVYWPEDTTWNDNAISTVRKNRITFMRYLTKIADQTFCFISSEHAQEFVWKEAVVDESVDLDEAGDRFFSFEVAKTNEQEENVAVRPGIEQSVEASVDPSILAPKLIPGETVQAFLTARYVAEEKKTMFLNGKEYTKAHMETYFRPGTAIHLDENLSDKAVDCILQCGMKQAFPEAHRTFQQSLRQVNTEVEDKKKSKIAEGAKPSDAGHVCKADGVARPPDDRALTEEVSQERNATRANAAFEATFEHLCVVYPEMRREFENRCNNDRVEQLSAAGTPMRRLKERLTLARFVVESSHYGDLERAQQEELLRLIDTDGDIRGGLFTELASNSKSGMLSKMKEFVIGKDITVEEDIRRRASKAFRSTSDSEFLGSLNDLLCSEPMLEQSISRAFDAAYDNLDVILQRSSRYLGQKLSSVQEQSLVTQITREAGITKENMLKTCRQSLAREINVAVRPEATSHSSYAYYNRSTYVVYGRMQRRLDPSIEYTIHPLALSAEDQQSMQMDRTHVPTLREQTRSLHRFKLPLNHRIRHVQLLSRDRCLLIVDNGCNKFHIYLEDLRALSGATEHERYLKTLHQGKLGSGIVFAFDEVTRLLSLCACQRMLLHVYSFDEAFSALRSAYIIELKPWYSEGTSIHQSCLVGGSEEILLIDASGQARVFSLITQQFRPASLALDKLPVEVLSSPDGACLFLSFKETEASAPVMPINSSAILTSIVNRNIVHLVWLDASTQTICSLALDIMKKVTEFSFQEKGTKASFQTDTRTMHNSLIDCHADVWTRFPVVPAIARQTVVTDVDRPGRSLVFVTAQGRDRFVAHFADMIQNFEQRTRKPTGNILRDIRVDAVLFDDVKDGIMHGIEWDSDVSRFHLGEWLVDVFCLIPIHIAITRDNRFVPLKDGVYSADMEKSLLGADVGQIVDTLSLGWYESIFQSYQSTKPVKVVSSMGKFIVFTASSDPLKKTCFWSCSMQRYPIFGGRSDTSHNKVLFWNNFALSRDIAGLFQSFQSSLTVLDPAANPSLFQSTLVIIIKDVVDSDKNEIVKEFSLKFQQIVQQEQDANFISKLHAGRLSIIPWPVIESKQFYTYFPALKSALDKQRLTHASGGKFLQTLKTLMAKLKSNDWGSIDR